MFLLTGQLHKFYVPVLKRSYFSINLHPFHTCTYVSTFEEGNIALKHKTVDSLDCLLYRCNAAKHILVAGKSWSITTVFVILSARPIVPNQIELRLIEMQ